MKKRIISIALVAVMIVAMIPAVLLPTAAKMLIWSDGYDTAIVGSNAITIDGSATPDAAYLNSEKITATNFVNKVGGSDESSDFESYFATDEKGLYFWVKAYDPSIDKHLGYTVKETVNEGGIAMEKDVTKYLGKSSGDKFQIYLRTVTTSSVYVGTYEFDYVDNNITAGKCSKEGVQLATTKSVEDKYWIGELYIPFTALNAALADVAFEDINVAVALQLNNQTTVASPAHKSYCYDQAWAGSAYRGISNDNGFSNGSNTNGHMNTFLNFSGYKSVVTTQNVTVDGVRDDIYDKGDDIKSYVGTGSDKNSSFVANVVANAQGVYVFADIKDTTLDKQPWEATGMGDKLQVYFKMANHFSSVSWGSFEVDYREERYDTSDYKNGELKADAVAKEAKNWANKSTTGMPNWGVDKLEYATTKVYDDEGNALGWTAELFIPWSGAVLRNGLSDIEANPFSIGIQTNNTALKEEVLLKADGSIPKKVDGVWEESTMTEVTVANYIANDHFYSHRAVCYANGDGSSYWAGNGSAQSSGSLFFLPVTFVLEEDVPTQVNWWASYSENDLTVDAELDAAYDNATLVPIYYKDKLQANTYYAFTDTDMYVYFDVFDATYNGAGNDGDKAGGYFTFSNVSNKFFIGANGKVTDDSAYYGCKKPAMTHAFKIKGTSTSSDDYTGYCVELKIALPELERAALAAGEATTFQIGVEITDKGLGQGFNDNNVGYYYNRNPNSGYLLEAPMYVLSKDLTAADFAVTPTVNEVSASLGQSIDLNLYATLPLNATDAQVKVTFNEKEYYLNAQKTDTRNEYKFTFENIAPQALGDVIVADLIVDGKTISLKKAEDGFTVAKYLEALKDDAKYGDVVEALLLYGAAAQKYTNYKADALVADLATLVAPTMNKSVKDVTGGAVDGAKIAAAGVHYANINKIFVKVEATDISKITFTATKNGTPIDIELAELEEGVYIAYTDGIKATEFGDVYTFTITDSTASSQTLKYSVYSYAQAMQTNAKNPNTKTLVNALYNYGVAAAAVN